MQTPVDSPNYPDLLLNFKSYKNIIEGQLCTESEHTIKMCLINLKKTWQTINVSLNRRKMKQDFPQYKLANGNLISDPKQIADAFNDFFANIGDTVHNNCRLRAIYASQAKLQFKISISHGR